MTALDHTTHAISAAPRTVATVARLMEALRLFFHTRKNRREVKYLAQMTDYQLADIGLMRADLEVVMHGPLKLDPTSRLSHYARERYTIECTARRVC
jgi:uncharacterized protein YjiS (DUF1127 family)